MELKYKLATISDLNLLTDLRLTVLRAANKLDDSADLEFVRESTRTYYETALQDHSHLAYLVYDGTTLAATDGISFYRVLPTYHNPTGENAYIMNLYTAPAYRNCGIATHLLQLLVSDARTRGVTRITLDATSMGRPLYERFGFIPMPDEMELPQQDESRRIYDAYSPEHH